jgi:hypothetical protein
MARSPFDFLFRDGEGGFKSDIDVIFFLERGIGARLQTCRRRAEGVLKA